MKNKEKTSLNKLLSGLYCLYIKTQNYHWNVKGPNFYSLHLLFEKHYQELATEIDSLAELISSMGEFVNASVSGYSKESFIKDAPSERIKSEVMISDLCNDHKLIIQHAEILIEQMSGRDYATNILSDIVELHNSMLWMLSSSL